MNIWDQRYAGDDYHFGTEPNAFLVAQQHWLKAGTSCLAVADGEGRNGVWLAQQGLDVLSVDASPVALAKAQRLANERGVQVRFELADLLQSELGEARYDVVVAIFIQFVPPAQRAAMFAGIKRSLKPGGLLLLQGSRRASWSTAPGGRRRPRICTPKHCCVKYSPTWIFCILSSMTATSAKGPGIAVYRRSSTWWRRRNSRYPQSVVESGC